MFCKQKFECAVFENCSASVIASESEWQSRLSHVLRQIGFGASYRLTSDRGLTQRHPTHLPFLIIHWQADTSFALNTIREVRSTPDDDVRFMPIIMLAGDSTERTIHQHLTLGCDDIIVYPCTAPPLERRLRLQIDREHDYFQTSTYFGPDRRKDETGTTHPDRRGGKGSHYRHIVIKRDVRGGVKVLSNQTFEPEAELAD